VIGRRGLGGLALAAGLTVAAAAAALRGDRQAVPVEAAGRPLLPGLAARPGAVTRLRVEGRSGPATLARRRAGWVVASKAGYPADTARLDAVVAGLAGLETAVPLTRRPALWPRLGLGDAGTAVPGEGDGEGEDDRGAGTRLVLTGDDGAVVADLVLGAVAPPRPGPDGVPAAARYARRVGDDRAWRVRGTVDLPTAPIDWLDRAVVHLPAESLARLAVEVDGRPSVVLVAAPEGRRGLALAEPLPGGASADPRRVALLAGAFEDLRLNDVRPAGALASARPVAVALATTADGLTVEARQVADVSSDGGAEGAPWVLFAASAAGNADPAAAARAEALRGRLSGWAYRLPEHRARRLAATADGLAAR